MGLIERGDAGIHEEKKEKMPTMYVNVSKVLLDEHSRKKT